MAQAGFIRVVGEVVVGWADRGNDLKRRFEGLFWAFGIVSAVATFLFGLHLLGSRPASPPAATKDPTAAPRSEQPLVINHVTNVYGATPPLTLPDPRDRKLQPNAGSAQGIEPHPPAVPAFTTPAITRQVRGPSSAVRFEPQGESSGENVPSKPPSKITREEAEVG